MARSRMSVHRGWVGELGLLVGLLLLWLAITVLLGAFSLLIWAGAVVMGAILRPPHQRRHVPESVTDVLTVAVIWSVAGGAAGLLADYFAPPSLRLAAGFSWALVAELAGFYLGLVWVLVLLLIRYVERAWGPYERPRPLV